MSNVLITVDLEDWFQVENLRCQFPRPSWQDCKIRVENPTHLLLRLFDKYEIKATFFVLGWLAKRLPDLIKKIDVLGHEIASHGYGHELCCNLNESSLYEDVAESKRLLEDIISRPVRGFRAPNFSVNQALIDNLKLAGYAFDSSYNDFGAHHRYGSLPGKWQMLGPALLKDNEGFYEIPVRNLNVFGKTIPLGGGGYFRLFPLRLFTKGVKRILSENIHYLFYCHPWEFDPGQPKVKGLSLNHRFRHYVGIEQNLDKLDSFLKILSRSNVNFLTCSQLIESASSCEAGG